MISKLGQGPGHKVDIFEKRVERESSEAQG
jgi:hypothetical protein